MQQEQLEKKNEELKARQRSLATGRETCQPIAKILPHGKSQQGPVQQCEKHGSDMQKVLIGAPGAYFCPECVASEVAEEQAQVENEDRQRAENRRKALVQSKLESCQIGQRFRAVRFDDYVPVNQKAAAVKKTCRGYADNFDRVLELGSSLLMVGSCGTGKNTLSAAICTQVIESGYTALHTTAMRLVRKIKKTWATKSDEQEAVDFFTSPDLLVIDEVGVQFGSATEQMFLTEVINDRYEARRPTIIIANLDVPSLEKLLGERVMDRFHEDGSRVLVFDWESYRRTKKG